MSSFGTLGQLQDKSMASLSNGRQVARLNLNMSIAHNLQAFILLFLANKFKVPTANINPMFSKLANAVERVILPHTPNRLAKYFVF